MPRLKTRPTRLVTGGGAAVGALESADPGRADLFPVVPSRAATGNKSPEREAVELRLAEVPGQWRSPELVAELRRAARAATTHRRLNDAVDEAARELSAALTADDPDITAAAAAQTRMDALERIRGRLDTAQLHNSVVNEITGKAAQCLISMVRDVMFAFLPTAALPEVRTTRQGLTYTDAAVTLGTQARSDGNQTVADVYMQIRQDAGRLVEQLNLHLAERISHLARGSGAAVSPVPDPIPWLIRSAALAADAADITARARAFEEQHPGAATRTPLFARVVL